jgi:hypothetical protein
MTEPGPRRAERNAGAFLTPTDYSMIPVPMRTLSDEYHDEPVEPKDSETVPPPQPEGQIRRIVKRLVGRSRP